MEKAGSDKNLTIWTGFVNLGTCSGNSGPEVADLPGKSLDDKRIRCTLEGYTLWVFRKLGQLTAKSESGTMTTIVDRWVQADSEFAEEHGLTLAHYREAIGEAEVVSLEAQRSARRRSGSD